MIDPHAVDQPFGVEPEDQRVHVLEAGRMLHAQPGQLVDVEEAPPVDLVIGDAPERETVMLPRQHGFERFRRRRPAPAIGKRCWKYRATYPSASRASVISPSRSASPQRLAEHRQQHLAAQRVVFGIPVDVEIGRVAARAARACSTSNHQAFSAPTAMWFGTISTISPSPAARSAATKRFNAASPPSSGLTRVGSITS